MKTNLQFYLQLLSKHERLGFWKVIFISTISALMDLVGVASIFPFMSVIEDRKMITDNRWVSWLHSVMGYEDNDDFITSLGLLVVTFILLSLTMRVFSSYFSMRLVFQCTSSISQRLFVKAIQQNYIWLHNKSNSELHTKLLGEVENYSVRTLLPLINFFSGCILTLAMMVLLFIINPIVATVTITITSTFFFILFLTVRPFLDRMGVLRTEANSERFAVIHETFEGIKTIKVLALEHLMKVRFIDAANRFAQSQTSMIMLKQLPKNALEGFAVISIVFSILLLVTVYDLERLPIGLFSLYAFAGYRLIPAVQNIFNNATALRYSNFAIKKLVDLEQSMAISEQIKSKTINLQNNDIIIENLCFHYSTGKLVLDNVSITIKGGEKISFIGPSGSGKTTLLDHITGLIAVQKGSIKIGGKILDSTWVSQWQNMLGYVTQDTYILKSSIANNIAIKEAPENIDNEKIMRCLNTVKLSEFVEGLENGINTQIGDGNMGLSGGQRQRLGIARAIYNAREVLILDEATNSLDKETEEIVLKRIYQNFSEMTVIMITHRDSPLKYADRIYRLDKGKILSKRVKN